jgi:hypothetical protein
VKTEILFNQQIFYILKVMQRIQEKVQQKSREKAEK